MLIQGRSLQASAANNAALRGPGRLLQQAGKTAANQTGDNRLSPDNAVLLIVDHQTGLMQLVRDWEVAQFRTNILGLAKTAQLFNLPVILTTSREDGPNGPLLPELKEMFPDAPYIARPGEINAWDNPEFKKAVEVSRLEAELKDG
jgi:nicotinamidase-related amidase